MAPIDNRNEQEFYPLDLDLPIAGFSPAIKTIADSFSADRQFLEVARQMSLPKFILSAESGDIVSPDGVSALRITKFEQQYSLMPHGPLEEILNPVQDAINHFQEYVGDALTLPEAKFVMPRFSTKAIEQQTAPHLESITDSVEIILVNNVNIAATVAMDYKNGDAIKTATINILTSNNAVGCIQKRISHLFPNDFVNINVTYGNILWSYNSSPLGRVITPVSELIHAALSVQMELNMRDGLQYATGIESARDIRHAMYEFDEIVTHGLEQAWVPMFTADRSIEFNISEARSDITREGYWDNPKVRKMEDLVLKEGAEYVLKSYRTDSGRLLDQAGIELLV